MSQLRQCVECGKPVSSSLSTCPHCGLPPTGVTCHVCLKSLRQSDAVSFFITYPVDYRNDRRYHYGYHSTTGKHFVCNSCNKKIKDVVGSFKNDKSVDCPVCRKSQQVNNFYFKGFNFLESHKLNCSNCGHNFEYKIEDNPFVSCTYCHHPVEKAAGIKLDLPVSPTRSRYGLDKYSYSHDFCYVSERQRISLEYQDATKIRQKVDSERSIKAKKDLAIEKRNSAIEKRNSSIFGIYEFVSGAFFLISLVYLVYAFFAGNVIAALIMVATAYAGIIVSANLETKNEAKATQGIEIHTLDDALKLPKGGYAKFYYRNSTYDKIEVEMDFDDDILSEILDEYNNRINIKAVTQADLIEKLTSESPQGHYFAERIVAKLRFKRLYYNSGYTDWRST